MSQWARCAVAGSIGQCFGQIVNEIPNSIATAPGTIGDRQNGIMTLAVDPPPFGDRLFDHG